MISFAFRSSLSARAGWITRAKREDTRRKRLLQMLDELKHGGVYMNMKWSGGRDRG